MARNIKSAEDNIVNSIIGEGSNFKGEFNINGFRNQDLRWWLYPERKSVGKGSEKKYSGRLTRRIKLLRVHGLVRKVPKTRRYVLTEKGRTFSCALLTASALDIKALMEMAA